MNMIMLTNGLTGCAVALNADLIFKYEVYLPVTAKSAEKMKDVKTVISYYHERIDTRYMSTESHVINNNILWVSESFNEVTRLLASIPTKGSS